MNNNEKQLQKLYDDAAFLHLYHTGKKVCVH